MHLWVSGEAMREVDRLFQRNGRTKAEMIHEALLRYCAEEMQRLDRAAEFEGRKG